MSAVKRDSRKERNDTEALPNINAEPLDQSKTGAGDDKYLWW